MTRSENILGTMPMGRLIFTMSGPIMLSMLMQAVYNLVDSIYVARLGDNAFLALSYAYPIQTLLIAFCVGTGVAFSATLSQRLGARQMDQASAVVLHGGSFYFGCWLLFFLFGLLGAGLGFLGYIAGQEIVALAQNWNGLLGSLQSMMDQLQALSDRLWALVPEQLSDPVQGAMSALLDWLNQTTPALVQRLADYTTNKAMGVPSFCVALVVYVMAAYFLTADYPYLRARAARGMDQGLLAFLGEVRTVALGAFGGYLKAELLLSVGVFFILLGGFVLTRQPYGLLLALGLAVLDFIPIVGAGTVMVPWAVVELVTRNFSSAISLMVIWGVIALFRRAMEPKFVGDQTGLSPVLSLLSVYVGMKLGGVLGMILGPVLTLVVLNLAGMGLFRGLRADLSAAAWDVAAILSHRPEDA